MKWSIDSIPMDPRYIVSGDMDTNSVDVIFVVVVSEINLLPTAKVIDRCRSRKFCQGAGSKNLGFFLL